MKVGIWLDKKKAILVTLYNGQTSVNNILSNVEDFRIHGGSGTRLKGGPQDVVQDSKYLEREKHQIKRYFDTIISEIKEAHAIVLFGPAETYLKLFKYLKKNHQDLSNKVKDVVKMDSITQPQIKAFVKTFFKVENV